MKLSDLLGHSNVGQMLEDMLEPETPKPPREKGADAIKVNGYIVHGHWRRRWRPSVVETKISEQVRRRRRSRALTPSELEAINKNG